MSLNDEFLRALGRVTANFSALEFYMDFAIGGLVGHEQEIGQTVAAGLSFKNKCSMLGSLFRLRVAAAARSDATSCLASLKRFLGRAQKLENRRNQIIHSAWLVGENDPPGVASRFKITSSQNSGLQHHSELIDVGVLNRFADELNAHTLQLIPLLTDCLPNGSPKSSG